MNMTVRKQRNLNQIFNFEVKVIQSNDLARVDADTMVYDRQPNRHVKALVNSESKRYMMVDKKWVEAPVVTGKTYYIYVKSGRIPAGFTEIPPDPKDFAKAGSNLVEKRVKALVQVGNSFQYKPVREGDLVLRPIKRKQSERFYSIDKLNDRRTQSSFIWRQKGPGLSLDHLAALSKLKTIKFWLALKEIEINNPNIATLNIKAAMDAIENDKADRELVVSVHRITRQVPGVGILADEILKKYQVGQYSRTGMLISEQRNNNSTQSSVDSNVRKQVANGNNTNANVRRKPEYPSYFDVNETTFEEESEEENPNDQIAD